MSTDDTENGEGDEHDLDDNEKENDREQTQTSEDDEVIGPDVRERLGEGADKAIEQFDEGLIDLLAWMLETETRARIYISLRNEPDQTSDEIAERTGLYPSTVREALASLHDDDIVTRSKRQNAGAGNNPYEYSAMPPSDLVGDVVDDIQHHLNSVFNLDKYMDHSSESDNTSEPVTITVTEESDGANHDEANTDDDSTRKDIDDSEKDNEE
ncbi:helix-turn-helix domain-containing protein [Halovenus rubra]|uniref:Helix-turn-helix domain-containing protein n=2 Tax=Halovenus rubra TaxID=869890 RepID=A0ABD5XAT8_9EURY|nr:winged helix-turn-helix domain-containing protein [Halovenus rubra]